MPIPKDNPAELEARLLDSADVAADIIDELNRVISALDDAVAELKRARANAGAIIVRVHS